MHYRVYWHNALEYHLQIIYATYLHYISMQQKKKRSESLPNISAWTYNNKPTSHIYFLEVSLQRWLAVEPHVYSFFSKLNGSIEVQCYQ